MSPSYFHNSSIKTKIILSLILVVSVVFATKEAYEYQRESAAALQELDETAHNAIIRLSENLELPLWEVDEAWVENVIETEMLDKHIYALIVSDDTGMLVGKQRNAQWQAIAADQPIEGEYLFHRKDVFHLGEKIGSVKLYVTTELMQTKFQKAIRNNVLVTILFVITITLSLLMALNNIVVFPLQEILVTIRAIAAGDYRHDVAVEKNDEIGKLANSFNTMKHNVQQRELELDKAMAALKVQTTELTEIQIRLEQDVAERIKAQKETEAVRHYLKNIFDSMPSMLVGVDVDGYITQWNMEAERISAIQTQEAVGQLLDEVIPILGQGVELVKTAIRNREPETLERISHPIKGQHHYADVVIYPLVGSSMMGAVIRIDDITERVRMELLMTQTEKMMSVGGMAAGMAHELNNPLGGMLQGLQNIRRRLSPDLKKNQEVAKEIGVDLDKLHEYLQQRQINQFMGSISEAGDRASGIVANMLNFSRKAEIQVQSEDMGELIDRTLALAAVDYDLKKKYDFRSIDIHREYAIDLPAVPCVASEIQQVLLNLLRNAAQALFRQKQSTETPRITVRTVQRDEFVCIEVEDNGPGLEKETSQRVFEPFFTTRPPGEGTGLGLSVSYYIIHDEHRGNISVESTVGEGAKFILCLPIQEATPVENPEQGLA